MNCGKYDINTSAELILNEILSMQGDQDDFNETVICDETDMEENIHNQAAKENRSHTDPILASVLERDPQIGKRTHLKIHTPSIFSNLFLTC